MLNLDTPHMRWRCRVGSTGGIEMTNEKLGVLLVDVPEPSMWETINNTNF